VAIRVLPAEGEQAPAMRAGTRRLLRLGLPSPVRAVDRSLAAAARLVLASNPDGSLAALLDDCADAAVDALAATPAWTRAAFEDLRQRVGAALVPTTQAIVDQVQRLLAVAHEVRVALPDDPPTGQADSIEDIKAQFRRLLPSGFVTAAGRARLPDLTRYLAAISRRLELLARDVATDRARMLRVRTVQDAYDELCRALPRDRAAADDVQDIAWQLEELRVSLWAQQLGTARPVSERRIYRAIDTIRL
jgi:ATP-dependent helicase HrpA